MSEAYRPPPPRFWGRLKFRHVDGIHHDLWPKFRQDGKRLAWPGLAYRFFCALVEVRQWRKVACQIMREQGIEIDWRNERECEPRFFLGVVQESLLIAEEHGAEAALTAPTTAEASDG